MTNNPDVYNDLHKMARVRVRGCTIPGISSPVSLLNRFLSLLSYCVGCVEIEDSSVIPFGTMEDLKRGSLPDPEPLLSRLRYASQVMQIRSQYLQPGDFTGLSRSCKAMP